MIPATSLYNAPHAVPYLSTPQIVIVLICKQFAGAHHAAAHVCTITHSVPLIDHFLPFP